MRELTYPSYLQAVAQDSRDFGKELRVYGYDTSDQYIRTLNIQGNYEDGFLVPIAPIPVFNPTAPSIKRITRIRKAETMAFIDLFAYNDAQPDGIKIGNYFPDETEPRYFKITLPGNSTDTKWVRCAYRKRLFKIRSIYDEVPIASPLALIWAIKSVRASKNDDIDKGQKYMQEAIRLMGQKQKSRTPITMDTLQIMSVGGMGDQCDNIQF